ncbi:SGNH/GDSL hydrolase family protein [Metamycoplasma neophronis]|uniref:SGNH/GDSL hydrolase family protein n=1 Tax=Metamycoplasma neophronis TaxID=872983 RepID=A0ABY2YZX3_9BACT|nr:SGNH/GDSL hydrolase family protein [Metamycoplasma neophronis]TPR54039.1 SGNH/GDSL hydrolase family protein [Metamycoplasma neophronis]
MPKYSESKRNNFNIFENGINYVALGDSFAAGFNNKLGFNTNGRLQNGEITGLGYPSFFAQLLRDNNCNLVSFDNLAIPSATIDFIDALVTNNKKKLLALENKLDLLQSTDWHAQNPFKDFFSFYFGNWDIKNNEFKPYYELIKNANLITITLGFSDLFYNLPYAKISSIAKNTNDHEIKAGIKELKNDIQTIANQVKEKYSLLIQNIRKINKNSQIVLTNYSEPINNLKPLFKNFLYDKKNKNSIYSYLFWTLSNIAIEVATENNIEYVNIYDKAYWNENSFYLNENIFSIFPTEKGYKKIGFDLFAKLSLNKNNFKSDIHNVAFLNQYIANPLYWLNDMNFHRNLFNLNISNSILFKDIYGKNKNYSVMIYSLQERKNQSKLRPYINFSDYLDLFVRYSDYKIDKLAIQYLEDKFHDAPQKYESVQLLLNFLSNNTRSKEVFLTFLKNNRIDYILFILQARLYERMLKNKEPLSLNLIKEEWKALSQNNQHLTYNVFKQFLSSGLIEDSKKDIKKIAMATLSDAMNTNILNYLFGFKNSKKFDKMKQYLATLDSFKELVDFVVDILINYSDVYSKLKDFDELWQTIIVNNKFNLMYLFDKMFLEITNESKIDETIDFIIQTISASTRMRKLSANDKKTLITSIKKIIDILKENPKFLNNSFLKFLDHIKDLSLYDLILKNIKIKKIKLNNIISFNSFLWVGINLTKNLLKILKIIKNNKI